MSKPNGPGRAATQWKPGQSGNVAAQFKKGQSGNPSGKPKAVAEIQALALERCPRVIELMMKIVDDEKAPLGHRIAAGAHILDRGLGRPAQSLDAKVQSANSKPLEELTNEELVAIVNQDSDFNQWRALKASEAA